MFDSQSSINALSILTEIIIKETPKELISIILKSYSKIAMQASCFLA